MKKKLLLLFLSTALAATTLAGCGNSTEEAAAPAVTNVSEAEEKRLRLIWSRAPSIPRSLFRRQNTASALYLYHLLSEQIHI